jgi:hypothetical protein
MTEQSGTPQVKKVGAAPSIEKKVQTVAFVQRQYFEGKKPISDLVVKNEPLTVQRFVTEPARVSVGMGLTLNLGNYESARIDVSLVVPCYCEETEEAYVYARDWVEKKLEAEVQDIRTNKPGLF